ncbi:protein-tyrosine phosphatase [Breznakia blatticola]|uniref:Protein-tyrosine phosphatase n=1 Tax=Breznakia blatticola TaxID=1754012 RepID=A0A4R7Z8L4_9FIRM|nr:tyrosine-protein phosphatase [Breznakia blatticola]TDW11405.1 protein-tyrosine phosphatase [Breznakia blatticola]
MNTLVNFRDLGGYKTPSGVVKKGKFFRSGELVSLSEKAKDALVNTYQIRYIFDFRQLDEVEKRPDDILPNSKHIHLDIMKNFEHSTSLKSFKENDIDPDSMMIEVYKSIIRSKTSQQAYKEFLETIIEDDSAILFHCFAGKDRTGIGAAFILKLLGVSDEDIYTDYLLTNQMRKEANEVYLNVYRQKGASEEKIKAMETMLYVKSEYLASAIAVIENEYGGFDNYIENEIGLSTACVEKMKERFII